jgi:hypothetical protein
MYSEISRQMTQRSIRSNENVVHGNNSLDESLPVLENVQNTNEKF